MYVYFNCFFVASFFVRAEATLIGVVRPNQIGGPVVKNVSISALGANPAVTGDDG